MWSDVLRRCDCVCSMPCLMCFFFLLLAVLGRFMCLGGQRRGGGLSLLMLKSLVIFFKLHKFICAS